MNETYLNQSTQVIRKIQNSKRNSLLFFQSTFQNHRKNNWVVNQESKKKKSLYYLEKTYYMEDEMKTNYYQSKLDKLQ